ncbi:hypothetical protein PILCRDRAFT_825508 [Piloderma croceum F 1598]|uniref:Uncharacterized protein n=1 Tax=Piloderma croceum (strain F 1598) TaxID=765440 RepID=A0A0C3ATB9_PILCF|nr:hypothetical protein PILCRDRAFT_825508 [Piloderma croceum F 1598]
MTNSVDFWVGPIPAGLGSIEEDMEEASAMEERADWGWEAEEGDEARIIWRAVGPHTPSATKLNGQSTDVHSRTATTTTLPRPASSGALEIAASPGVPILASRMEHAGPETCVRWSAYIQEEEEDPNPSKC